MIRRLAILLLVGGGLLFFLQREGQRGAFDGWERPLLESLWRLMTPRAEHGEGSASPVPPVVLVEVRRGDLPFEGWPPAPLDFALIFENLIRHEPAAVAVTAPLAWPVVEPLDAATLRERVMLLPRGVLACTLQLETEDFALPEEGGEGQPPAEPVWPLAVLEHVEGDRSLLPEWGALGQAPVPEVRGEKPLGFTRIELGVQPQGEGATVKLPLLARRGEQVVAGLLLQTLLAWKGVPASEVRAVLGREIVVTPELCLPIDETGAFSVFTPLPQPVTRVSAGELWEAGDETLNLAEADARVALVKGALVVVAVEGDSSPRVTAARGETWSEGELTARALEAVLSGRHIREVPFHIQAVVWGGLLLAGAVLMAAPRRWQALWWPGGLLVLALAVMGLFVQSFPHWWLPPVIPAALWVTCGLLAVLLAPARVAAKPVETSVALATAPAQPSEQVASESAAREAASEAQKKPAPSVPVPAVQKPEPAAGKTAVSEAAKAPEKEAEEVEELARQCLEDEAMEPATPAPRRKSESSQASSPTDKSEAILSGSTVDTKGARPEPASVLEAKEREAAEATPEPPETKSEPTSLEPKAEVKSQETPEPLAAAEVAAEEKSSSIRAAASAAEVPPTSESKPAESEAVTKLEKRPMRAVSAEAEPKPEPDEPQPEAESEKAFAPEGRACETSEESSLVATGRPASETANAAACLNTEPSSSPPDTA